MRYPVSWAGKGNLAQGEFRMKKEDQHLRMKWRKGSLQKKPGKPRQKSKNSIRRKYLSQKLRGEFKEEGSY